MSSPKVISAPISFARKNVWKSWSYECRASAAAFENSASSIVFLRRSGAGDGSASMFGNQFSLGECGDEIRDLLRPLVHDPVVVVGEATNRQVRNDVPHQVDVIGREIEVLVAPDDQGRNFDDGSRRHPWDLPRG